MITNLKTTIWTIALLFSVGSVLVLSSCGEDEPEPIVAPGVSYQATEVTVGEEGAVTPGVQGSEASYAITDDGGADFVTVDASTGVLSVAAESTTGVYSVIVKATNAEGSADGTAEITISINEDFDPTGELMWKYWMNFTEDVVLKNLNTLPGGEDLPEAIPIPVGWPANWPAIDPSTVEPYMTFSMVQGFLLQVPGDDACGALDPVEKGNTLLLIVNPDLTLSTNCTKEDDSAGTTVEIGTSTISFSEGKYIWTMNTSLQGNPITFVIDDAKIADFTDPLDPHFTQPSGTPRTFSAVQGRVDSYMTPTDFSDYLGSLALLEVDVVLEVL